MTKVRRLALSSRHAVAFFKFKFRVGDPWHSGRTGIAGAPSAATARRVVGMGVGIA
jgi:hypothetical protein